MLSIKPPKKGVNQRKTRTMKQIMKKKKKKKKKKRESEKKSSLDLNKSGGIMGMLCEANQALGQLGHFISDEKFAKHDVWRVPISVH